MKTGLQLIADERVAQISEHGFDAAHDEGHAVDLAAAALSYASFAHVVLKESMSAADAVEHGGQIVPPWWPWLPEQWHPTGDTVVDLTKAGALIAAAIDSLNGHIESADS